MHAGKFAQSHGDRVCDEGGNDIAEDHAGAGHLERRGGAEEKSGADGAPDGDHGHLADGELMVEALFVSLFRSEFGRGGLTHGGTITKKDGIDQMRGLRCFGSSTQES